MAVRRGAALRVAVVATVAVVVGPFAAAGCTERARPVATSAPRPEKPDAGPLGASAPSVASAAPADAALPSFASWTDPPAVDALLRGAELPEGDKDPRSCDFAVPQQSCVPGADAIDWSCRSDCARGCGRCAGECRAKIAGCRAPCAGQAPGCEGACGLTAGKCIEACLHERESCAAECVKQVASYQAEVSSNYGCKDKRPALEICKRAVACMTGCDAPRTPEAKRDACRAACKKSRAAGCHDAFVKDVDDGNCMPYESPI